MNTDLLEKENQELKKQKKELIDALELYLSAGHKEARRIASIKAKEAIKNAKD